MEKFGVVTDTDTKDEEKTAEELHKCPVCGITLSRDANVPHCAEHGTAPFEKSDAD